MRSSSLFSFNIVNDFTPEEEAQIRKEVCGWRDLHFRCIGAR